MGKSSISWTDKTWNPIRARNLITGKVGWHCEPVTAACANCYAGRMNEKPGTSGGTGLEYKPGNREKVGVYLYDGTILEPLSWRDPCRCFVCSMTDIFGAFVSTEMIDRIFAVMSAAGHVTFQILTKRPSRMREYMSDPNTPARVISAMKELAEDKDLSGSKAVRQRITYEASKPRLIWPPRNIWVGTSICDQENAEEFVPKLLATPAQLHFVSAAPLLGPINLTYLRLTRKQNELLWPGSGMSEYFNALAQPGPKIDWVLTEGESGLGARPTNFDWFRKLRDDCAKSNVAFHHKQNGEWVHLKAGYPGKVRRNDLDGLKIGGREFYGSDLHQWPNGDYSVRIGLSAAGCLLDGRMQQEFPKEER